MQHTASISQQAKFTIQTKLKININNFENDK